MSFNLQNSINFSLPFVEYVPVTSGFGQEPAISIASAIRNTFLQPPQTWPFNRNEITFPTVITTVTQDYPISFATNGNDFGFVEKVTLTDDSGKIYEIKDVYNNAALSKTSDNQQRPSAVSVHKIVGTGTGTQTVTFRFMSAPNAIYTVTVTYQKLVRQFGPYFITSVANHAGPNTTYTGTFDPYSLVVGDNAVITGFVTNAVNNGTFAIVSVTPTSLVVVNGAAVSETAPTTGAFVSDYSWDPIPDQYSDIYNNLFLAEVLAFNGDPREQLYRQRGIAAFIAKADGLTEMQKNAFLQQWLDRGRQRQSTGLTTQISTQGRAV